MQWRKRDLLSVLVVNALALLTYPLSWLPSTSTAFRFNLALPMAAVALAILLFGTARTLLVGHVIACPRALIGPCALVVVSGLVAVRFSQQPFYSVGMLTGGAANVAILLLASQFSERRLLTLAWAWLVAATLVAINGLVRLGHGELLSTFGNRNFLGAYLAASLVIGVGVWNWRATPSCVLLVGALVFTQSRGAWLALGLVGLGWLALSGARGQIWKSLVIVLVVGTVAWFGRGYIIQQWQTDVRPLIWRGTLAMSRTRWLFGHGLGTFAIDYPRFRLPEYFRLPKAANLTDHAHNELLETLAEQGVLGLVATVWIWITALRLGSQRLRQTTTYPRLRTGLLAATVLLMVHGMIDVDLRYPPNQTLLWLLMGIISSGGTPDQETRLTPRDPLVRKALAALCIVAAVVVAWFSVVQPVRADYWERQARIEKERGELLAAAEAADRALAIQPLRVGTRYFLAGVLAETPTQQARARAIDEAQRVERLAPDYGDITFNLGQVLVAEHRPGEALEYLQRAVRMNPYNADKRVVLAFARGELGQWTAACEQLEQALTLDPGNTKASALLAEYQRRSRQ